MKILQVIPYFYPAWRFGGPVRVAYDISRKLVERGHSVTVYTTDIQDENSRVNCSYKNVEGVDTYYFRNLSLYAASRKMFITPSLISALKDNVKNFDVVHIHGNRTTQSPLLHYFLKKNAVPYVVQAHGGLPGATGHKLKQLYNLLFGYALLKDASKVVALTQTEAQQYLGMGVPEEKIAIIPNGIDLSEYVDLPLKGSFKKKFGIKEDEKIVLYLARIHKIKGVDILAKAFANVIKKLDDVRLVVVGPDDGYLRELKSLIRALKIENKVLISGPLYGREKLEAYVDADVYVLPSRYEIWGLTVLEAYACGKPVVASRVGGLGDILVDGATGFSVEPENVTQLANAVYVVLKDEDRARQMGSKGKLFVKENFDIQKTTEELESLYEEVLQDAHKRLRAC
jgi:glycosyltransferase involved in cell wall biosynthesis